MTDTALEVSEYRRATVDSRPLAGRTALVTGGSRGVGAGVAVELARRGADVAVTYNRRPDDADRVVESIRALGVGAAAVQFDAADPVAAPSLVDRVDDALGAVDLFVSNAGIASRGASVADTPSDEYQRLMSVHAWAPIAVIQRLLPAMRTKERSDIVIVSSATTDSLPPRTAPYVMAKSAMEAAARVLAYEEREHGVHVNVVAPGLVATDMGRRLVGAGEAGFDETATASPFGRVCTPADVASVIAFLAGPGAGYVTGTRLLVDGGGPFPTIY